MNGHVQPCLNLPNLNYESATATTPVQAAMYSMSPHRNGTKRKSLSVNPLQTPPHKKQKVVHHLQHTPLQHPYIQAQSGNFPLPAPSHTIIPSPPSVNSVLNIN